MPPVVERSDTCDQTVMDSPPAKAAKTTSPFLELPAELRVMIYGPLIQAGDLSILRISKRISQETVPLISNVATCRAIVGCPNSSKITLPLTAKITFSGLLTFAAPKHIQNLDLRIDLVRRVGVSINAGLIQCFSGSEVARRSCQITIILGVFGLLPPTPEERKIWEAIADLTGFKTLTLKLEFNKDISIEDPALRHLDKIPFMTQAKVLRAYDSLTLYYTKTLGPTTFDYSPNGRYLSFQPRDYKLGNSLNVDS